MIFFFLVCFLIPILINSDLEDVTKSGNGAPGTGVWERLYSGNSHEKLKWLTKPSKESEFACEMKAKFFRLAPLFAVIGLLTFISILPIG